MLQQMEDLDNIAKAEALFQKLKTSNSYSERSGYDYEEVVQLNPKHVGALWQAARFFDGEFDNDGYGSCLDAFKAANSERAISCLRKIIEIDPNFSEAYKRLARYFYEAEKEKALEYYLEYLKKNPEDYGVIALIGQLYHAMNRKEEAISSFSQCLQHDEKDLKALNGLANVYEDQENFEDALKCLKRCNQINSNKCVETHVRLAQVYDKMGKIDKAINQFRWCVQLHPHHKQAHAYFKRHSEFKN